MKHKRDWFIDRYYPTTTIQDSGSTFELKTIVDQWKKRFVGKLHQQEEGDGDDIRFSWIYDIKEFVIPMSMSPTTIWPSLINSKTFLGKFPKIKGTKFWIQKLRDDDNSIPNDKYAISIFTNTYLLEGTVDYMGYSILSWLEIQIQTMRKCGVYFYKDGDINKFDFSSIAFPWWNFKIRDNENPSRVVVYLDYEYVMSSNLPLDPKFKDDLIKPDQFAPLSYAKEQFQNKNQEFTKLINASTLKYISAKDISEFLYSDNLLYKRYVPLVFITESDKVKEVINAIKEKDNIKSAITKPSGNIPTPTPTSQILSTPSNIFTPTPKPPTQISSSPGVSTPLLPSGISTPAPKPSTQISSTTPVSLPPPISFASTPPTMPHTKYITFSNVYVPKAFIIPVYKSATSSDLKLPHYEPNTHEKIRGEHVYLEMHENNFLDWQRYDFFLLTGNQSYSKPEKDTLYDSLSLQMSNQANVNTNGYIPVIWVPVDTTDATISEYKKKLDVSSKKYKYMIFRTNQTKKTMLTIYRKYEYVSSVEYNVLKDIPKLATEVSVASLLLTVSDVRKLLKDDKIVNDQEKYNMDSTAMSYITPEEMFGLMTTENRKTFYDVLSKKEKLGVKDTQLLNLLKDQILKDITLTTISLPPPILKDITPTTVGLLPPVLKDITPGLLLPPPPISLSVPSSSSSRTITFSKKYVDKAFILSILKNASTPDIDFSSTLENKYTDIRSNYFCTETSINNNIDVHKVRVRFPKETLELEGATMNASSILENLSRYGKELVDKYIPIVYVPSTTTDTDLEIYTNTVNARLAIIDYDKSEKSKDNKKYVKFVGQTFKDIHGMIIRTTHIKTVMLYVYKNYEYVSSDEYDITKNSRPLSGVLTLASLKYTISEAREELKNVEIIKKYNDSDTNLKFIYISAKEMFDLITMENRKTLYDTLLEGQKTAKLSPKDIELFKLLESSLMKRTAKFSTKTRHTESFVISIKKSSTTPNLPDEVIVEHTYGNIIGKDFFVVARQDNTITPGSWKVRLPGGDKIINVGNDDNHKKHYEILLENLSQADRTIPVLLISDSGLTYPNLDKITAFKDGKGMIVYVPGISFPTLVVYRDYEYVLHVNYTIDTGYPNIEDMLKIAGETYTISEFLDAYIKDTSPPSMNREPSKYISIELLIDSITPETRKKLLDYYTPRKDSLTDRNSILYEDLALSSTKGQIGPVKSVIPITSQLPSSVTPKVILPSITSQLPPPPPSRDITFSDTCSEKSFIIDMHVSDKNEKKLLLPIVIESYHIGIIGTDFCIHTIEDPKLDKGTYKISMPGKKEDIMIYEKDIKKVDQLGGKYILTDEKNSYGEILLALNKISKTTKNIPVVIVGEEVTDDQLKMIKNRMDTIQGFKENMGMVFVIPNTKKITRLVIYRNYEYVLSKDYHPALNSPTVESMLQSATKTFTISEFIDKSEDFIYSNIDSPEAIYISATEIYNFLTEQKRTSILNKLNTDSKLGLLGDVSQKKWDIYRILKDPTILSKNVILSTEKNASDKIAFIEKTVPIDISLQKLPLTLPAPKPKKTTVPTPSTTPPQGGQIPTPIPKETTIPALSTPPPSSKGQISSVVSRRVVFTTKHSTEVFPIRVGVHPGTLAFPEEIIVDNTHNNIKGRKFQIYQYESKDVGPAQWKLTYMGADTWLDIYDGHTEEDFKRYYVHILDLLAIPKIITQFPVIWAPQKLLSIQTKKETEDKLKPLNGTYIETEIVDSTLLEIYREYEYVMFKNYNILADNPKMSDTLTGAAKIVTISELLTLDKEIPHMNSDSMAYINPTELFNLMNETQKISMKSALTLNSPTRANGKTLLTLLLTEGSSSSPPPPTPFFKSKILSPPTPVVVTAHKGIDTGVRLSILIYPTSSILVSSKTSEPSPKKVPEVTSTGGNPPSPKTPKSQGPPKTLPKTGSPSFTPSRTSGSTSMSLSSPSSTIKMTQQVGGGIFSILGWTSPPPQTPIDERKILVINNTITEGGLLSKISYLTSDDKYKALSKNILYYFHSEFDWKPHRHAITEEKKKVGRQNITVFMLHKEEDPNFPVTTQASIIPLRYSMHKEDKVGKFVEDDNYRHSLVLLESLLDNYYMEPFPLPKPIWYVFLAPKKFPDLPVNKNFKLKEVEPTKLPSMKNMDDSEYSNTILFVVTPSNLKVSQNLLNFIKSKNQAKTLTFLYVHGAAVENKDLFSIKDFGDIGVINLITNDANTGYLSENPTNLSSYLKLRKLSRNFSI